MIRELKAVGGTIAKGKGGTKAAKHFDSESAEKFDF